jgi:very-short-patch-repair endonuclease
LPGSAKLRDVLLEVAPGFQVVWEGLLYGSLRAAGLAVEPQVSVPLGNRGFAILDLALPELRLGIEIDGLANHLDRFRQDRERDRLLFLAGWLIVRVAAPEVAADLDGVVRQLCAVADRRSAELNLAR